MADYAIKQGDTLPPLIATLLQGIGTPQDLTGCTVTFRMETLAGQTIVNEGACTIVGLPTAGTVQYAWGPTDTAAAGLYEGEFHVTFAGGAKATFPTLGTITIEIEARLA